MAEAIVDISTTGSSTGRPTPGQQQWSPPGLLHAVDTGPPGVQGRHVQGATYTADSWGGPSRLVNTGNTVVSTSLQSTLRRKFYIGEMLTYDMLDSSERQGEAGVVAALQPVLHSHPHLWGERWSGGRTNSLGHQAELI